MKKITLFLFLCIAFSFNASAQFLEDFTSAPAGWVSYRESGNVTLSRWEHVINPGYMAVSPSAGVTSTEDWFVSSTAPITTTNSKLIFDQTDILAQNNNSILTIRIAEFVDATTQTTHADFTIVDTQTELEVSNGQESVFSQHSVDLSAYEGKNIHIAFVWEQTQATGDALVIDNVNLIDKTLTLPDPVTDPIPAFTATDVDLDETNSNAVTFSWTPATTGGTATSYTLLFGSSPETLSPIGSTPNTSASLTNLAYSTEYYWAIAPTNALGSNFSVLLWSFTTEADPSLSTDDNELAFISIYPNPVKDIVNIKTTEIIDGISIVNQLGQNVLNINKNQIFNNSINLSALNKGLYFMSVTAENRIQTIKIIKE